MIKPGKIRKELRRLRLKDGDVLVINSGKHVSEYISWRMGNDLRASIKKKVLVIVTTPGITLEQLDETAMNRLGWFRPSQEEAVTEEDLERRYQEVLQARQRLMLPATIGVMEGQTCNRDGCQGTMALEPLHGCTCFQNAPCSACMGRNIVCNECGEAAPNGD